MLPRVNASRPAKSRTYDSSRHWPDLSLCTTNHNAVFGVYGWKEGPDELPEEEPPEGAPCRFCSRKGEKNGDGGRKRQPITHWALGYVVSEYAALAKVEDVSQQDLRHRFGSVMAEKVPLHRLAQIMGHDSLDTMMIYVRGTQADLQRAVEERAWA